METQKRKERICPKSSLGMESRKGQPWELNSEAYSPMTKATRSLDCTWSWRREWGVVAQQLLLGRLVLGDWDGSSQSGRVEAVVVSSMVVSGWGIVRVMGCQWWLCGELLVRLWVDEGSLGGGSKVVLIYFLSWWWCHGLLRGWVLFGI